MGQQQLLLIVLGIIIIGIAIFVGVNYFRANAIDAKRDNVSSELVNLASVAQQYFIRPKVMGGGSRSFTNWVIPSQLVTTANGHYNIISISADEVKILGTGNEVITGNDSVKVQITINSSTYKTELLN